MSHWEGRSNRTNLNKMFCCDCESIVKSTSHTCNICRAHTVSVGKKARWPKFPKKEDYEHFAMLVSISCSSGHPETTLESVRKFVMKHGNERDIKRVEASINHKKELAEAKLNEPVRPETVSMRITLPRGTVEFYEEKGFYHNPNVTRNWVVNANVLKVGYSIDVRHIRKLFIPKKTKVYRKGWKEMVSNGIPVYEHASDTSSKFIIDSLAFFGCERDALLYSRELAEAVLRVKNADKRLVEEAKLHIKHCEELLVEVFPHYYI